MPGHYGNSYGGGGRSNMNRSSSARRTTRIRGRGSNVAPRSNAMNMRTRTPRATGNQSMRAARMRRGAGTRVSTPPAQMRANRVVRSRRGVSGRNMMNQHGGGRSSMNASATNLGRRQTGLTTVYGAPPRGGRNSRSTAVGAHGVPSRHTGLE